MGRKKKDGTAKPMLIDKLGEKVEMEKCPECFEHTDCFACIQERCTALKESGGQGCVFYKPSAIAEDENMKTGMKLIESGNTDAIAKYRKTLMALGCFDDEISAEELFEAELSAFAEEDFKKQMQEAAGGEGDSSGDDSSEEDGSEEDSSREKGV
jgi:hypothetical protein